MIPKKEWSTMRKLMILGKMAVPPAVEATATGNPLVFTTDLAKPLKSLVANFLPVQASGTPSPENVLPITGWTGVNVGKNTNEIVPVTWDADGDGKYIGQKGGTVQSANYHYSNLLPVSVGDYVYIFSVTGTATSRNTRVHGYNSSGEWVKQLTYQSTQNGVFVLPFTVDSDIAYIRLSNIKVATDDTVCVPAVYPVTFPALGKNLFDEEHLTQYARYVRYTSPTQAKWTPSDDSISYSLPVQPNTTYTVSVNNDEVSVFCVCAIENNVGGAESSNAFQWSSGDKVCTITTSATEKYLVIQINKAISQERAGQIQVELGETATAYEPYTNTVYGGTLDVVSGVLTVEWATKTFDSSPDEVWYFTQVGSSEWYRAYINIPEAKQPNDIPAFADTYKAVSFNNRSYASRFCMFGNVNESPIIFNVMTELTTVEAFKEYLAENPLTIAYILATPQEITLTPEQITALKGDNTIWSDADGSMTAVYLKKG